MNQSILHTALGLVTLAATLAIAPSHAQDGYPARPVRLVVPYPPGGLPDTMARTVGQRLTQTMGQPFIVENRPGAGGIVATEGVAKSPADGYTLLVADAGQTSINLAFYPKLPYDTLRDFAPITRLGTSPLFLGVHASSGVGSLAELLALARSKPGQLSYASSGNGSPHHLAMEMLKSKTGVDIVHVPYKGSGQSTPAFVAGQVAVAFAVLPLIASHVKAGTIRLVAIANAKRSAQAPDVPTFAEQGVADMVMLPTISVLAPAGTPRLIVQRLAAELGKVVHHPESVQRFAGLGIDPVADTPEAYTAQLKSDIAYYANAVRISGAKAE